MDTSALGRDKIHVAATQGPAPPLSCLASSPLRGRSILRIRIGGPRVFKVDALFARYAGAGPRPPHDRRRAGWDLRSHRSHGASRDLFSLGGQLADAAGTRLHEAPERPQGGTRRLPSANARGRTGALSRPAHRRAAGDRCRVRPPSDARRQVSPGSDGRAEGDPRRAHRTRLENGHRLARHPRFARRDACRVAAPGHARRAGTHVPRDLGLWRSENLRRARALSTPLPHRRPRPPPRLPVSSSLRRGPRARPQGARDGRRPVRGGHRGRRRVRGARRGGVPRGIASAPSAA